MLKEDLEALTGKLIQGDLTPIVVGLLKDTRYKRDLLKYLSFCSDKELIEKVQEGCSHVDIERANQNSIKENNSRSSLEEWITKSGVDLSL